MVSFFWKIRFVEIKVETILKVSLDSIQSPSVKIQIMGGKVCLRCKGKTLLGVVNKLLKNKKFVDITQQCFALLPQVNFPANNLNFHWSRRWWDRIQATLHFIIWWSLFKQKYLCVIFIALLWKESFRSDESKLFVQTY